MKKKLYIYLCIIFLSIVVIAYNVQALTVEQVVEEKKIEISKKIEEMTGKIEEVNGEIVVVSEELQELNERIGQYQEEVNTLNTQLSQLENEVEKTQKELNKAEENYKRQKKLLEDRIIAMYKGGETIYLDVLLKSKSIEDFISKYYYLLEVAKFDRKLLENVQSIKQQVEIKKEMLVKQKDKVKLMMDNKERTSITLENTKVVRNSYLDGLNEQQLMYQENLEEYEDAMQNLERNILSVALYSLNKEYIGGALLWPVPGYTTVTSPYGMRIHPLFKIRRMHTGVDIGAPKGTNVVAVNSGVVTLSEYSSSYGNYIMINHGGGVVTLYAHADKLIAKVGDVVQAGDVIMEVGTTGWSTGYHLHFEVRIDGNHIDPLPYITNIKGSELKGIDFSDGVDILERINKSTTGDTAETISNTINTNTVTNIIKATDITNTVKATNVVNTITNAVN